VIGTLLVVCTARLPSAVKSIAFPLLHSARLQPPGYSVYSTLQRAGRMTGRSSTFLSEVEAVLWMFGSPRIEPDIPCRATHLATLPGLRRVDGTICLLHHLAACRCYIVLTHGLLFVPLFPPPFPQAESTLSIPPSSSPVANQPTGHLHSLWLPTSPPRRPMSSPKLRPRPRSSLGSTGGSRPT